MPAARSGGMTLTVAEALRQAENKAALVRFGADSAAGSTSPDRPDDAMLNGLGDVCGEIEDLVRRAREALDVRALATELGRHRR